MGTMKKRFLAAVLATLSFLAFASHASAAAGIGVTKTCPTSPQAAGVTFNCIFKVTNRDTVNQVTGLSVTNTVPCPDPPDCTGGSTAAVPCLVDGAPVTALAPAGSPGSSCSGTLQETAPDCAVGALGDFLQAQGTDNGQGIGGGAAQSVAIVACTPPPGNTPTSTPTSTPSGIGVTKDCPTSPQAAGVPFNCSFTVANRDTVNQVTGLSVKNTVPCPDPPDCTGGSTAAVPCLVNGIAVTTLAPAGSPGSSCSGTLQETAPNCAVGAIGDFLSASGTDNGRSIGGGAAQSVPIVACTPPPGSTPTQTPIGSSTNTPTPTPTRTPTPTPTATPSNTTPTVTPTPTPRRTPRRPTVIPFRPGS